MLVLLRKIRDRLKGLSLVRRSGVDISPNAKVEFRLINMRENCKLTIGEYSIVGCAIIFERPDCSISIGNRTYIGRSNLISAENIEIGDDILISWGCTIVDHNSHSVAWPERQNDTLEFYHQGTKTWDFVVKKPVKICNKAWIGFDVTILKGVTIGEGAVVGAASVVTKDVPPYTVVAGNPAKVIREIPLNER